MYFGFFIGIIITLFKVKENSFLFGVVLTVIIEQLILGTKNIIEIWIKTRPVNKLLGTISDKEDCYIYFSSFYRDLKKPDEFKLLRFENKYGNEGVLLTGPDYLLGEGDAIALSSIYSLLIKIKKKPELIHVDRGEIEIEKWGRSCFCIGTHNPKTRVILKKYKNSFFNFDNNYGVITKNDSKEFISKIDKKKYRWGVFIESVEDSEQTDYGFILKLTDQFHDEEKTIFVVAGIGPAGTSGAAYYLLTHTKELSDLGKEFGILVQVPSGYQSVRKVEFEEVKNIYIPK